MRISISRSLLPQEWTSVKREILRKSLQTSVKETVSTPVHTMTVEHPPPVPTTSCRISRVPSGVVFLTRSGCTVITTFTLLDETVTTENSSSSDRIHGDCHCKDLLRRVNGISIADYGHPSKLVDDVRNTGTRTSLPKGSTPRTIMVTWFSRGDPTKK